MEEKDILEIDEVTLAVEKLLKSKMFENEPIDDRLGEALRNEILKFIKYNYIDSNIQELYWEKNE